MTVRQNTQKKTKRGVTYNKIPKLFQGEAKEVCGTETEENGRVNEKLVRHVGILDPNKNCKISATMDYRHLKNKQLTMTISHYSPTRPCKKKMTHTPLHFEISETSGLRWDSPT